MRSPEEFYNAFNGIGVNKGVGWNDSAFGYQCVAGFKAYCEYEGVPVVPTGNGYASGYWYSRYSNGLDKYFDFIDDVKDLRRGDWCIWANGSSCPDSHIAMYWKGVNGSTAQFFGQNQGAPYFNLANIRVDILGAYRLKGEPMPDKVKMRGIDVSSWNDINLDISQFDFLIIRACWGTNLDTKAEQWRRKAEALNIPYGVYLYSYALDDIGAKEEAHYILDVVKDWNIQMGIWYDMEIDNYKSDHNFLSPEQWTSACNVFCTEIQSAGYYTGIYASQSYFSTHIHTEKWDRWVASWGSNDGTIQRDTSNLGTILQFTSRLNGMSLDGNVTYCDLDHYKSYPVHAIPSEPALEPEPAEPETPAETIGDIKPTGSVFSMPNWLYDLLKFIASILLPLLTTLYVALADIWKWGFTKEIVATVTAFITFINGLLAYSSIEYSKRKE